MLDKTKKQKQLDTIQVIFTINGHAWEHKVTIPDNKYLPSDFAMLIDQLWRSTKQRVDEELEKGIIRLLKQ